MIKNDRQYRITKAQAHRFAKSISDLSKTSRDLPVDPLLRQVQLEAAQSQFEDLEREMTEYDALKSGKIKILEANSLEDLPRLLIQARIAAGLSQKDLANRMQLKEQQIQRYEATGYWTASLSRIRDVVNALGLKIKKEIALPDKSISVEKLLSKLKEIGLDRDFVLGRLTPRPLVSLFERKNQTDANPGLLELAATLSRIYDWSVESILGKGQLSLGLTQLGKVRFKSIKGADIKKINAYTYYVIHLSHVLLEASAHLQLRQFPRDATNIRDAILSKYKTISLRNTLDYIWGLGVPVLPLYNSAGFHGACYRFGGRNVIALKQRTRSLSRWLYDLLHEFDHARKNLKQREFAIIETIDFSERASSEEEQGAHQFASFILLGERAEELIQMCVAEADGKVEYLKRVVPIVARRAKVDVDSLANCMAFRLSLQNINWWGAANNLQEQRGEPWRIAREVMLEHVDLTRLSEIDKNLLLQAS